MSHVVGFGFVRKDTRVWRCEGLHQSVMFQAFELNQSEPLPLEFCYFFMGTRDTPFLDNQIDIPTQAQAVHP